MKNKIATTIALLVITILANFNTASAGERMLSFEMAESGITIEFPLTTKQIAAKEFEKTKPAEIKEDVEISSQKRFKEIEMGESGQIVKFAMSAEEIAAEDAELARLAAIRGAKSRELQNRVAKFELGESGIVIEFPVESDEIAIADTDFSEDPSITNLDRKGIRIAGSVNRCSISNQG